MTYEQFKELALKHTQDGEKRLGIDKMTVQERCEFYFNCGWQKALVVARSGSACDGSEAGK